MRKGKGLKLFHLIFIEWMAALDMLVLAGRQLFFLELESFLPLPSEQHHFIFGHPSMLFTGL